jgi:EAL domain-containing protein (putative c-di-GMP-specific phosphodiesterase class I)/CheY-like chemotaxis protein
MSVSDLVCVVDDDAQYLELLTDLLCGQGLHVQPFQQAQQFLDADLSQCAVVILDLFMPDLDGVDVLRILASRKFKGAVILTSGQDQSVLRTAFELAKAQRLTILHTFTKPIPLLELANLIAQTLADRFQAQQQIQEKNWIPNVAELSDAINSRQLVLHYQPKIDVSSGKTSGFEALVRWQHPEFGLIPPFRFIRLAEQFGLMGELTASVLLMAMEQLASWNQQGLNTRIAVNISAENLTDLEFPQKLLHLMQQFKIAPAQLLLEITETAVMNEVVLSLDILIRLRMNGIGLSIDDFGTGYSSLAQLHRIPFSELKIDRRFVHAMGTEAESLAIVETCVFLGHRLGMKVVAEGVETASILRKLQDINCDQAQGFYWSKALAEPQATAWLQNSTEQ